MDNATLNKIADLFAILVESLTILCDNNLKYFLSEVQKIFKVDKKSLTILADLYIAFVNTFNKKPLTVEIEYKPNIIESCVKVKHIRGLFLQDFFDKFLEISSYKPFITIITNLKYKSKED